MRLRLAVSTDLLHVDRILILVYPLSEQVIVKADQQLHLKIVTIGNIGLISNK